jgi:hypothetical protein
VTVRVTGITIALSSGTSDNGDVIGTPSRNGARWSQPLDKPVKLPGGMSLITLAEAGAYILDLPEEIKRRNSWQRATDLLLKAASGAVSVEDATAQIEYALFMEMTLLLRARPPAQSGNDGEEDARGPDDPPQ